MIQHPEATVAAILAAAAATQTSAAAKSPRCRVAPVTFHVLGGPPGAQLSEDRPELSDAVLVGVGSGGPGFNTYRPDELAFLIQLTRDLKARKEPERRHISKTTMHLSLG